MSIYNFLLTLLWTLSLNQGMLLVLKINKMEEITLPAPETKGEISVEEALSKRRSIREYKNEPLTLKEVSQLLWAAQGITAEWGGRTAPSAGATYPLEIYLLAGKVEGLNPGVYHYIPASHSLKKILAGDLRKELSRAALGQRCIKEAPITLVITAIYDRTTVRYRERGIRYVHLEAGHVGENIYLQAEALGLGTVGIGAFYDEEIKRILKLKKGESVIYLMPVGKRKE